MIFSVNINIFKKNFYSRATLGIARNLIGCFLVRQIGKKTIRAMITDVEAYAGENDLACHASRGRTPRTEIMYGEAGHAYVYFVYGMHYILNIVTERKNFPAAAMIRGVKIEGVDYRKTNGPAKLAKLLRIDKKLNGWDLARGGRLWIEKGIRINPKEIKKTKRVGIDYAKHCRYYLWRFHFA